MNKEMSITEIAEELDLDEDFLFNSILSYGNPEIIADKDHKILEKIPMSVDVWKMIANTLASVMVLDMQFKPEDVKTFFNK